MLVAQLSDIHAKPGGRALEALGQALDWLDVAQPDALIVSGDVANPPWPENYPLVRAALERVACPILMVPGNKDDRDSMRSAFPDAGWEERDHLSVARTIEGVRIVGLDVTVPGEKYGDAAPVLGWLGEQLTGGEPVLLFLHQHPFRTGFPVVDNALCRSADALAQTILEAPARVMLVTCGHGHRTVFTSFADARAMMCPSLAKPNVLTFGDRSAPAYEPPGFAIHLIEDNRAMSHVISLRRD